MGRRRCAWCEKDMGAAATEKDTHGICAVCAERYFSAETRALRAAAEERDV